ncbi:MAG: NnrS family protein [Kiloniellales bacterium]|nr:NnrS family protein [Kiloniellales bacterium]
MQSDVGRYDGAVLFAEGFRPFFLAAALHAVLALPLWLLIFSGRVDLGLTIAPSHWHAHEMLFGYLAAVLAGFLLTAVPNWTGRLPISGRPLAGLFALWLLGRLAQAPGLALGPVAPLLDVLFLVVLAAVVWREIWAGRNLRNLPICLLVTCFAAANIGFHLLAAEGDPAGFLRGGVGIAALLIALVGGRVVPSFTRNWLAKRGEAKLPRPFGRFDQASLAVTALALLAWVPDPEGRPAGLLLIAAGLLQLLRLLRWRGWRSLAEPLVLVLHLGFAWLPVGLALLGLAALRPEAVSGSAGLHALTAGAVGLMTLAIMTRATLGHTGRPLTAGPGTQVIYALVLIAAVLRVAAPWLPLDQTAVVISSGLLWSGGFLGFVLVYGPMLLRRRRPGAAEDA